MGRAFKEETSEKWYICGIAFYSAEIWTLQKGDRKYLENLKCGGGGEEYPTCSKKEKGYVQ
jgi:hypothetical protein